MKCFKGRKDRSLGASPRGDFLRGICDPNLFVPNHTILGLIITDDDLLYVSGSIVPVMKIY